jgi:hypothetical protein
MKYILLLIMPAFLYSCSGNEENKNKEPRVIHSPDVSAQIQSVISDSGFGYHEDFLELISRPSVFLTDFFGILPVKEISKNLILKTFVPEHAELTSLDNNVITLDFKAGYSADFHIHSALSVFNLVLEYDHIQFSGTDFRVYKDQIGKFTSLLKEMQLEDQFLIRNKFFEYELIVDSKLSSADPTVGVIQDSDLVGFSNAENAILIFPDPVHGIPQTAEALLSVIENTEFDWFGLEMLSDDFQSIVDDFLQYDFGTESFRKASDSILAFYSRGWLFNKDFENPEENYFYRIFLELKNRQLRIYALEPSYLEFLVFRNGETIFGAAVRNCVWAENASPSGKGIVFGGSSHFNSELPINFQDFMRIRNENLVFFIK